jgi:Ni/Co efflux regulator RcnB
MKRMLTAVLAAATFAAPLALPAQADAQNWRRDHDRDYNRDRDRDYDRDRDGDRDHRRDWRRSNRHWDHSRYNGYSYRGRWYYGPPPAAYEPYARYEWRSWRRGDRLPAYYRDRYRAVDYRYYHLRPPPRGYRWVRDDRGEMLLVGIATGVILSAILSNNY